VETAIFVAVSIVVAAVIGYITNYLAIKMLFLPRREWRVLGRRVPFTPGLIPKRKGEIAASLGRVVSDYLVTADGLKEVLQQPELRGQVERKLRELVESWAEREETLEEVAARLLGPDQAANVKQALEQLAERLIMDGVRSLWGDAAAKDAAMVQETAGEPSVETDGEADGAVPACGMQGDRTGGGSKLPIMHRPLSELLDQLNIPVDDLLTREAVPWIVQALRAELSTSTGLYMIHRIVSQMLGGLGGMMGMLAGMFVDEDKIALKVRDGLLNYLTSPAASDMLGRLLMKQKEKLAEQAPAELLGKLRLRLEQGNRQSAQESDSASPSDEPLADADWYASYVNHTLPWRNWINRMWAMTPKQLLARHKEQLLGMTPIITERLMNLVSDRIDQAVRTLNLSKLVQKQVEDFPMDQVEEVILSITGREFKAITWLGALLGGIIGIVQVLFYVWLGI